MCTWASKGKESCQEPLSTLGLGEMSSLNHQDSDKVGSGTYLDAHLLLRVCFLCIALLSTCTQVTMIESLTFQQLLQCRISQ